MQHAICKSCNHSIINPSESVIITAGLCTTLYFYAFARIFGPILARRAATMQAPDKASDVPHQICKPIQLFRFHKMAPATGVPIKRPNPVKAKVMPIRVPSLVRLGERLTTVGPGRETNVPEKKPYKIQNPIKPDVLWMAIQQKTNRAATQANGIWMLRGPILSAKKLGTIRPKNEAALMIERR